MKKLLLIACLAASFLRFPASRAFFVRESERVVFALTCCVAAVGAGLWLRFSARRGRQSGQGRARLRRKNGARLSLRQRQAFV